MIERLKRSAPVSLLILLVSVIVACGEQVSGSLGCPQLCLDESAALRDTVLTGSIAVDTSLIGYPGLGETRDITMWNVGDTADVRLVVRFDTLPNRYVPATAIADSSIVLVDSSSLIFFIDTSAANKPTTPITVEAYDVDTTAADTANSALVPLFRADRLIGTRTFQAADIKDTLKLPLNNAMVFAKIRDTLKLRIGLRVLGPNGRMRVLGSQVSPRLRFRVSPDTSVKPDTVFPQSNTPKDDALLASVLSLYQVTVKGQLGPPPPTRLTIGGLSGARTFIKFAIPPILLDSVQVIRASLQFNQLPARSTGRTSDTLTILTHPVLSSPKVTDVRTAITFLGSPFSYGVDSVRLVAKDSGTRNFELVNLFRFWRAVGDSNSTRAIVLTASQEGAVPGEIDFSSLENLPALRPRLRITYVPRRGFGLP